MHMQDVVAWGGCCLAILKVIMELVSWKLIQNSNIHGGIQSFVGSVN